MKLNDRKALRELDVAALLAKVADLQKQFAVANMQFRVGKLKNVRQLSTLRDQIAITKTVISEKERLNA